MNLTQAFFYFFAIVTVGSAVFMVSTKNIIYAGFSLLSTFFGVAAIYIYAKADFIAVAQLVVYVGGILILLLFGVMLTNKVYGKKIHTGEGNRFLGLIIAVTFCIILFTAIFRANISTIEWINEARNTGNVINPNESSLTAIGVYTMTDYLLPFEVIAVILMVALLGAAYMSRREGSKR